VSAPAKKGSAWTELAKLAMLAGIGFAGIIVVVAVVRALMPGAPWPNAITFIPVGINPTVLRGVPEIVETRYPGMPARLGPQEPLSLSVDAKSGQLSAAAVLKWLSTRPAGTVAVVAPDLSSPGLNFVFGLTDMAHGRGVLSIARFGPVDGEEFRRRLTSQAVSSVGKILGLAPEPCTNAHCALSSPDSIADLDAKGDELCAEHRGRWARLIASHGERARDGGGGRSR
jgi:predicted Zn-dependent protease